MNHKPLHWNRSKNRGAMSLPLPEPSMEWPSLCVYNASELEDYGQACREAALEEAINCYSPDDTATDFIEKIRSLK